MEIKVDTKEKFSVLHLPNELFSVNVAEELTIFVTKQLQQPVKNVIVNFSEVKNAEIQALVQLAKLHSIAYEKDASFVICNLQQSIIEELEELDFTDILNITPTESEAWDIVQMEEIEREFLNGD